MGTGIAKTNRLIAIIAALVALLVVSVISSSGAWGASRGHGSGAAQSSSRYPQSQPPAGFRSKYAEVNGFRMHYLQGGKGSPVVMIHGFPQTWAEWRQQMGPLSRTHTVIAVDLRGTGSSQVTKGGYQAAQMARDVHQLLTQLRLNNGVQVVAHDIGVWVGYDYAAQWPSEVRRMAAMEAPIPDEGVYSFPVLNADPKKPSAWHFGMFQLPLAEHLIAGHERVFVQDMITEYLAGNKSPFTSSDYDFWAHYLKEPGRTTAWMTVYRQLRADVQQNKEYQARGKLTMPILAVGAQDSFGGTIADQWRDYAVNVHGRVLKDSGHFVTEEKPHEVTAMLQSFLQK
ncbi:alpha/beta fold hydrolase [Actinopolymorpha pittospori]|uniref:Pimeloyl-ACP methyl ester carboxylesterase n=1 Tax=Actinopolymorpha pittospori TaxID=648752 RepID=A0A927MNN6_9ACTN|nr:alpha/beta hydrolase [Actinopolymorpha pittospori]MBE1604040.1 pimeloyl-ACP methyl ester carboxylesterase [Actinopolymorpha pittospori]